MVGMRCLGNGVLGIGDCGVWALGLEKRNMIVRMNPRRM